MNFSCSSSQGEAVWKQEGSFLLRVFHLTFSSAQGDSALSFLVLSVEGLMETIALKLFNSHVSLGSTVRPSLDNGFEEQLLQGTGKSVSYGRTSSSKSRRIS